MQNNSQSGSQESEKPAAWSSATVQPGAQVCFVKIKKIILIKNFHITFFIELTYVSPLGSLLKKRLT